METIIIQNKAPYYSLILFFFFLFIIPPPSKILFFPDQESSDTENRKLSVMPRMQLSAQAILTFPVEFEKYFNDHFGFRDTLIKTNNYIRVMLLKKSPVSEVILGKDHWLFYSVADMVPNYRGISPLSRLQLKAWKYSLESKHAWLAKRGIRYLFVVAPNKQSIYPEFMPDYLNKVHKTTQLDQLLEFLETSSVLRILDVRNQLIQAKAPHPVYFATDTHWNSKGAFIAYEAIIEKLNEWFPEINKFPPDFIQVDTKAVTGMGTANMLGLSGFYKDAAYMVTLNSSCASESGSQPFDRMDIPSGQKIIFTECKHKSLRAVIFRDSFFTPIVPFLSEHFREAVYVWSEYNQESIAKILKTFHPDIVIEEKAERWLFGDYIPVVCHNIIGKAMLEKGLFTSAVNEFRQAANLEPSHPKIQNTLGYALMQAHLFEEAAAQFEKVLELQPGHNAARQNLQLCIMHLNRTNKAIHQLEDKLKNNINDLQINYQIGLLYKKIGKTDSAIQFFHNVLKRDPNSIQALSGIAEIYDRREDYDMTISYYKKIITIQPERKYIYYNLACVYSKKNDLPEACSWMEQALKKGYDNPDLIKSDRDLDNLRQSACFNSILKSHNQHIPLNPPSMGELNAG